MDTLAMSPRMVHMIGLVLLLVAVTAVRGNVSASVVARSTNLGVKGESHDWVTVTSQSNNPSPSDWIAVFSQATFNGSLCLGDLKTTAQKLHTPYMCSAPVKFQYSTSRTMTT
ncbi:hypothetical protein R1flu_026468 [Riccia fluitans]|uniref:Purple acid phosphatase Fn3-like domain-containing protein n=1 Tax=Riccia fluitans TaxID=41844 RepID=A0ABD1XG13_9MARC